MNRASLSSPADQIQVVSLRLADVVGDHTVTLAGPSEVVELEHRVRERRVFAVGALKAARWIAGRQPGFYRMSDVMA